MGKKARTDPDGFVKTCNYCHHLGHTKEECFKLKECSHCGRKGHARENCFKLRKSQYSRPSKGRGRGRPSHVNYSGCNRSANNSEVLTYSVGEEEYTPVDDLPESPLQTATNGAIDNKVVLGIVDTVMERVLQALSEKSNTSLCTTNFVGIVHNSTTFSASNMSMSKGWIVDSGASDHMTSDIALLTDIQTLSTPVLIGFPDGSVKVVTRMGTTVLSYCIHLFNVLLVPDFKQNLLPVRKLIAYYQFSVVFTSTACLFQAPSSNTCIAKAEKSGDLYWFKSSPSSSSNITPPETVLTAWQ
ncbi:hypothetical protein RND81_13G197800 [Saponaria officinalis]|uniref:CCHC-type domain-containing protein n=1 Tax=Saponaria officinalis TaxID=3572 RepID=A0AAW1GZW8_SAPOF